ncbi:hypothetical protein AGMMS49579_01140 [Spirochaetia bacterium]|nr:hypothetical protein AGMMS49579_01140 [Spirochaetia bacterium]
MKLYSTNIKNVKKTYRELTYLDKVRYINTICKNGIVYFYVYFEGEPLHIEEQYTQLEYLRSFKHKSGKRFCYTYTFHPVLDIPIAFEKMIISNHVINTHTFIKDQNRYEKIIFGTTIDFYNPVKRTFVTFEDLKTDPNITMIPYKINDIIYYFLEFKKDDEIVYMDYGKNSDSDTNSDSEMVDEFTNMKLS